VDTRLARLLLQRRLVPEAVLVACLSDVRQRRWADPDVSLALLLVERRLLAPDLTHAALQEVCPADSGVVAQPASQDFGPYEVVGELARGGMGVVFEVVHETTGVHYALKTLLPGAEFEERERLVREAELNARLDHPHVVRIHAAAVDVHPPYLVQDFLPNGTLQAWVSERGPLDVEVAAELALKIAEALRHAHKRGVVHRDLKPLNVLLDDQNQPRVVDWGIARSLRQASIRLTATHELLGTPAYMAPEQVEGGEVGPATDAYALGGLLFYLLSGRPPFVSKHALGVLDLVLHQAAPSLGSVREGGSPPRLERLLAGLLAKAAEDRPPLDLVCSELRAIGRGEELPSDRLRVGVVLGVFFAAALVALAWFLVVGLRPSPTDLLATHAAWEERVLAPARFGLGEGPLPGEAELSAARAHLERLDPAALGTEEAQRLQEALEVLEAHEALAGLREPSARTVPMALVRAQRLVSQDPSRAERDAASVLAKAGDDMTRGAALLLCIQLCTRPQSLSELEAQAKSDEAREAIHRRAGELLSAVLSSLSRLPWHETAKGLALALQVERRSGATFSHAGILEGVASELAPLLLRGSAEVVTEKADLLADLVAPGEFGPALDRALRIAIKHWTEKAERSNIPLEAGQHMSRALALEECLYYTAPGELEPTFELTGYVNVIRSSHGTGHDTLRALHLARAGGDRKMRELALECDPKVLQAFLDRHPGSRAASVLLALTSPTAGSPRRRQALEAALGSALSDLNPGHRAVVAHEICALWSVVGQHEQVERWALAALAQPEARCYRGQPSLQATVLLARAYEARGESERALSRWDRLCLGARTRAKEAGGSAKTAWRRILARGLLETGRIKLREGRPRFAEIAAREGVTLSSTPPYRSLLMGLRCLLARCLEAQNKHEDAWKSLALNKHRIGHSVDVALCAIDLALKTGRRTKVEHILRAAWKLPLAADSPTDKQVYRLSAPQRKAIRAYAQQHGISLPAPGE
jgi:hypothetical protein